jgi:hypothetical protein
MRNFVSNRFAESEGEGSNRRGRWVEVGRSKLELGGRGLLVFGEWFPRRRDGRVKGVVLGKSILVLYCIADTVEYKEKSRDIIFCNINSISRQFRKIALFCHLFLLFRE